MVAPQRAVTDKPRKKLKAAGGASPLKKKPLATASPQPQVAPAVKKKKKQQQPVPSPPLAAAPARPTASATAPPPVAAPPPAAAVAAAKGPGTSWTLGAGAASSTPPRQSYEKGKPVLDDTRPTYFLFVDRLPYRLESPQIETELRELMRPYGTLRKLYRRKKAGFGYITFRSTRSLEALMAAMKELQYDGRTLRIEPAKEDVAKKSVTEKSEYLRQVFLRNLPHDMTKDILKAFIQDSTGLEPQWVKLIQKSSAAFVTFATEEETEQCATSLHGQRLLNQKISAERARPPPEKVPQLKPEDATFEHLDVLLGPISVTVTEQSLSTVLRQAGCEVAKLKLLYNPHTGKFKECARLLLEDAASAQRLYNAFHGKMLFGRPATVEAFLGFADEGADFDAAPPPDAASHNKRPRIERPTKPAKKAKGAAAV